jgi:hypothetical protein
VKLGLVTNIILSRLGGLLPVLLTGGIFCVALLAGIGLWQLTWAVGQVSSSFERRHQQRASSPPPPVSQPPAVAGGAEPAQLERASAAIVLDSARPGSSAPAPRLQLEEPNPIPEVSLPAFSPPPACENMFVYIVSISPRFPERSAASIASGPSARGRFRRLGQSIEDWEVTAIRDDWSGLNPEVWLSRGEQVCRAELAGNAARTKPKPRLAKRKRKRRRSR